MTSFKEHQTPNTPIPDALLDSMLASIGNLDELRCILRALWSIDKQSGSLRYVTIEMLENDLVLQKLKLDKASICSAMKTAERVGLFAKRILLLDNQERVVFVLAAPTDLIPNKHSACVNPTMDEERVDAENPPNIFSLYESTIGMVTPFIADELKESENTYPAHWIREAFTVAASLNKRNWRYIAAILNRWYAEDKQNGKSRRHIETIDPKRYLEEYSKRRGGSFRS